MNEIKHISQTNNSIRVFCICPNTFFNNGWHDNKNELVFTKSNKDFVKVEVCDLFRNLFKNNSKN